MHCPTPRFALFAAALTLFGAPLRAGEAPALEETPAWEIGFGAGIDFTSKQLTYGLIDNPHPSSPPRPKSASGVKSSSP